MWGDDRYFVSTSRTYRGYFWMVKKDKIKVRLPGGWWGLSQHNREDFNAPKFVELTADEAKAYLTRKETE